jgi:Type II CAAX prenyl endopeptidase Rce1-like
MPRIPYRALSLVEGLALSAYIGWYIWQLQAAKPDSWIVFPVWLVISFLFHRDTPKSLGWRADNLWPATRRAALVFGLFMAAVCAVALWIAVYDQRPAHSMSLHRFLAYSAFCLLQQVALNSYLTNRLLCALQNTPWSALLAGAIFSALHWPNPVLVPLTFVGGAAMSWLFARERNILPLALAQAILGTLVWWAFPVAWHHGMRVGPGYYAFHSLP